MLRCLLCNLIFDNGFNAKEILCAGLKDNTHRVDHWLIPLSVVSQTKTGIVFVLISVEKPHVGCGKPILENHRVGHLYEHVLVGQARVVPAVDTLNKTKF